MRIVGIGGGTGLPVLLKGLTEISNPQTPLDLTAPADVYVINTCSVTQAAERKSRQMVRRLARQNPAAVVVMTGCYGEMAKIKGETVEEATLVVPNQHKLRTLELSTARVSLKCSTAPSAATNRADATSLKENI